MYDSPLNEDGAKGMHHNGEFVELFNMTERDVDLSGWTLSDCNSRYTIPDKTIIKSRSPLLIAFRYPGSDFNISSLYPTIGTGTILYQDNIQLSNDGESITLKNKAADIIDAMTYRQGSTFNPKKNDFWCFPAHNGERSSGYILSLQRSFITYSSSGITSLQNDYFVNKATPLKNDLLTNSPILDDIYDNLSLDTNLPVGSIPGQATVSPSGAAIYQIPIDIPAGTNGYAPQVTIAYNSQSGTGALGRGWDISAGSSSISRTTKNRFYDGQSETSIKFSDEDQLSLDGQRLILMSGTHFTVGAEYATEIENYSRVTIISSTNGIAFRLTTKDGQTMDYGNTTDSRVTNANSTTDSRVLSWKLNKSIDIFGNSISYEYDNHGLYLQQIKYVGVIGSQVNTIKFNYYSLDEPSNRASSGDASSRRVTSTTRIYNGDYIASPSSVPQHYYGDFLIRQDKILKSIEILNKNNINTNNSTGKLREYQIKYISSNLDIKLNTITLVSGSGSKLNSTKINWGLSPSKSTPSIVTLASMTDATLNDKGNTSLYTGDIDGDGKTDLIEYYSGSEQDKINGYIRVISNNTILYTAYINQHEGYAQLNSLENLRCGAQIMILDINNDGKDEIVFYHNKEGIVRIYGTTKNHLAQYTVPGRFPVNYYSYHILPQNQNQYPSIFFAGYSYVYYNGIINQGTNCSAVTPTKLSYDLGINIFRSGDFNSDGKQDLFFISNANSSTLYDKEITAVNSKEWSSNIIYRNWTLLDGHYYEKKFSICEAFDYNNDGLTDLLVQCDNNKEHGTRNGWFILKNEGGFFKTPSKITLDFPHVYDDQGANKGEMHTAKLIDYNGDGYNDVIIGDEVYNNDEKYLHTNWYFYKNTGINFISDGTIRTTDKISKMNAVNMDINNDGVMDLVFGSGSSYKAFTSQNAANQFYVSSITDGDGFSNKFTYSNISNSSSTTCPTNVRNIYSPMWLVKTFTEKDGSVTTYSYGVPKAHTDGKGFLGFESITSSTSPTGLTTTTSYEIDSKHFSLQLKSHQVKNTSSSAVISYSEQTNRIVDSDETNNAIQEGINGENRYLPLTTHSTSNDYMKGIIQESTSNTFDANWNVTKLTEIRGDATKVTETSYKARSGQSILTLPEYITVTQKRTGMPDIVCNTTYSDYNSAGQAQTKLIYPNTDGQIKTEYVYYSTGNLNSVTVTPTGCAKQKTTYNYDNYKRFVSSEVTSYNDAAKIADQTTSITYDYGTGNVLSKTSANGLTTSYHYDSFGVLDYETQPNGEIVYYTKTWTPDHGAMYKNTVSYKNNKSTQSVYYDYMGREIYTETTSWDGKKTLVTSKQYNSKGLLERSIMPRYSTETKSLYTDYVYDVLQRPTTVSTFDGTNTLVTTSVYNTNTTTITPPNADQAKTITTDAQGLVVGRSDAGGSISYTYDAAGKPRYIQSNGSTIEIKYDAYGNQQTLIDPDAGTIRYHYYSDGKLKSEINAKGDSTALKYDDAGRLDTKTVTEYKTGIVTETQYTYVSSGNGIGQPLSVTMTVAGTVKHAVTYSYNAHHQIESTTEVYDGNTVRSSISYDNLWRPEIYTSPSGLVTTNVYNDYGSIYQVKKGSSVIWEGTDVNNKGQFTGFSLGNGLITTRTYSDRGELTGINTNFKNTTTNYVQNAAYVYDPNTGNLTERNDIRNGRDEFFGYDNSDRLTSITLNGTNTYSMTYKANGNIDTKSDVGTYGYGTNGGGPHALSKIKGYQAGVSTDKQFIEYTSFQKVSQVKQGADVNSITKTYDIYYGLDEERIKTVYTNGTAIQTRYYFGSYEKTIKADGTIEETDYIYTPSGLTCMNKTVGSVSTLYYLHTDLLGSITAITNSTGSVVTSYAYTAWGERKLLSGDNTLTDRGYTFHEHLEAFGLINMNGRMYDPVLARFLSPDPYVQSPDNSQSLNRYSYCLNNPFKYTDPTGKCWNIVIPALIGGAVNLTMQFASGKVSNVSDAFKAFGVGALAGLAGAGAGALAGTLTKGCVGFAAGSITGSAAGLAGGFVSGMGNALMDEQYNKKAVMAGLKAGGIGLVTGGILGGISSGINSVEHGGNFWDGKGARFSFDSKSALGITDKKSAIYKSDKEVHEVLKKEIGWTPGKYDINNVYYDDSPLPSGMKDYLRGDDGILYHLENGSITRIGGHTEIFQKGAFSSIVDIYISPFDSYNNFAISMNHELIHAYHMTANYNLKFMSRSEFDRFTETSAYTNTKQYNNFIKIPSRYQYNGTENIYDWPSYLLKIK